MANRLGWHFVLDGYCSLGGHACSCGQSYTLQMCLYEADLICSAGIECASGLVALVIWIAECSRESSTLPSNTDNILLNKQIDLDPFNFQGYDLLLTAVVKGMLCS